jgi:sugar lactone lactonase YvrE
VRSLDTVLDGLKFPEGPRWRDGRLVFSDMLDRRVVATDLSGKAETVGWLDDRPSGLGQLPDGRWVVVGMNTRQLLLLGDLDEDGTPAVHADLSAVAPGPCNDMVIDGQGRAYVGVMAESAPVLLVTADGAARVVADGIAGPNGAVITGDGRTLIFAETRGSRLLAWTIADDGGLSDPRVWADLGEHSPDGICLDAEGAVWVSAYQQHRFVRVLEGGRITDTVDAGPGWALACALGGDDGRTLLGACAVTSREDFQLDRSTGWIGGVTVDGPGVDMP